MKYALAGLLLLVLAASPQEQNGRYAFDVEGNTYSLLDTRTGYVCKHSTVGYDDASVITLCAKRLRALAGGDDG